MSIKLTIALVIAFMMVSSSMGKNTHIDSFIHGKICLLINKNINNLLIRFLYLN